MLVGILIIAVIASILALVFCMFDGRVIASVILLVTIIVLSIIIENLITKEARPVTFVKSRDYQIELTKDSIFVYDGERYIGAVKHSDNPLDSLFAVDNQ